MARTDSLRYDLRSTLLPGIKNNNTKRAYKREIDSFCTWARACPDGPKHLRDVSKETIQAYCDDLQGSPKEYSPATIHMKLSPVCKAASVPLDAIRKPKRTARTIKKGRSDDLNRQGHKEALNPKNERLLAFQRVAGLRRAELERLKGNDWDGTFITVRKGKGGKTQKQFILPGDRQAVEKTFSGIGPEENVFSKAEMNNKIDLHSMRAQHAKDCYAYYAAKMDENPDFRNFLKRDLLERWKEGHKYMLTHEKRRYLAEMRRFNEEIEGIYKLRGENRQKAETLGLPTEYDKTALMAVSVLHLAHWRNNVTVINYLIR